MSKPMNHITNKLCVLFLVFSMFSCGEALPEYENALCITNVAVIDAQNGLREHQTVVVQEGRIVSITHKDSVRLLSNNEVIDGTGKYLIPGLWDTHVHFAYDTVLAPSMLDLFFVHGITSVRDTGGRLQSVKPYKQIAEENPMDLPRVMMAGPLIDGTPNVYDGSSDRLPPLSVRIENELDVVKVVNRLEKEGVDLLKAYEMLSEKEFLQVMKLAKTKGLPVAGHIPLSMDAISVSEAGMNSIEHMRNLELSCASNSDSLLQIRRRMLKVPMGIGGSVLRASIHKAQKEVAMELFDDTVANEVLDVFAKNNTWQVPTLVLNGVLSFDHVTREDWRDTFKLLPDSLRGKWLAGSKRIAVMLTNNASWKKSTDWQMMMLKKVKEKNIGIMAGTDTPIAFLTPGYSLHEELYLLVQSGLSPLEALATATLKPAEYFGLEHEEGLLQEGFLADMVLIEGNPLENIRNTRNIQAVIKGGKFHGAAKLEQRKRSLQQR